MGNINSCGDDVTLLQFSESKAYYEDFDLSKLLYPAPETDLGTTT